MDAADPVVRNARAAVKIDALLSAVRSMDMGGPQW